MPEPSGVATPAAALPTADDWSGGARPGASKPGEGLFDDLQNGVRAALSQGMIEVQAKVMRAQFDANPLMVRLQEWLEGFKTEEGAVSGSVDVPRSEAVLDARYASLQFGGRNAELEELRGIKGYAKKIAEREGMGA